VTPTGIYAGVGKMLYKLNPATGTVVWRAVTNANQFSQINTAPVVVGNLVIEATAQYEEIAGKPPETFRGNIGAWDATTGHQVWNLYTTPDAKGSPHV
jgi:outer membrane protein assembly factor BamB